MNKTLPATLEDDLDSALQGSLKQDNPLGLPTSLRERLPKTMGPAKQPPETLMTDATNPDTERATRAMLEQMRTIVSGLERDIRSTEEVRFTVNRRIIDLQSALKASRAALEVLEMAAESQVDKQAKQD